MPVLITDKRYTDGIFSVDSRYGFNLIFDPMQQLPSEFSELQQILNNMPVHLSGEKVGYLGEENRILTEVERLPNLTSYIRQYESATDRRELQAIYRGYTFLTSAYLLEPVHQEYLRTGKYGVARDKLPRNIAEPLCLVSRLLEVSPWLDYHYSYSLGNYVKLDESGDRNWENLDMACKFSGTRDEVGFIMVHVDLNRFTNDLIRGIWETLQALDVGASATPGLQLVFETILKVNNRRREMWKASDHKRYNDFRTFIMGIKGNTEIFPNGVVYDGEFNDEPQFYRGQSGSQDDIIPTLDIFSGVVDFYPDNILTKYLLDMRQYRPRVIQEFMRDLEVDSKGLLDKLVSVNLTGAEESLMYLYQIVEQIYLFRNGHWMFVQKYIMENTKYSVATGGTPITTWIPNQIEACLRYMEEILSRFKTRDITIEKAQHARYVEILTHQIHELQKVDYDAGLVYYFNQELKEQ